MFATRAIVSSFIVLGLVALSGTMAVPDEVGKLINPNGIKIDADESHYDCTRRGVHCIFATGDFKSYSVSALSDARGRCTQQFEEPGSGKSAGPLANSGTCKADNQGMFLVECTVTQGSSYAVIDIGDGRVSAHSVGSVTVQLKNKRHTTDFEKDPALPYHGVDAYVRCPNAP